MSIGFPNLGIQFDHVIRTVSVFSFSIAIYGITMALGILGGLLVASWTAKKTGQNPDDYTNIALLGIVLGLLGARIYYVVFSWDYYRLHPGEILILPPDTACLGMVTGQIIGRWGNFFNREAFGEYTDNLLAMRLPLADVRADAVTELMHEHEVVIDGVTYIQVHPTFLYESLWNLAVLAVLMALTLKRKKRFDGEIFLLYLLLYGIGRIWIESLRTDQLLIPGTQIPVSQVLAAVLAVVSAVLILVLRRKHCSREREGHT